MGNQLKAMAKGVVLNSHFEQKSQVYTEHMVHKYEIRVRYSDTDQMQRLHHAAYAEYLEVVRIEFLRSIGMAYKSVEEAGYLLPVSTLEISYRKGALYDDVIVFETTLEMKSDVRIAFHSRLFVDTALIAEACVELACIAADSHRPVRMPESMRSILADVAIN